MVRRRSSALVGDSVPPQDCSTAVRRADQERRVAVTPAWKEMYGFGGGGGAMLAGVVALMALVSTVTVRLGWDEKKLGQSET